jgi:GR25 family glycosyltransferase involved in LPS biosynthesis
MAKMKAIVIRLKDIEVSEQLADECIKTCKSHGLIVYPYNGVYGEKQIIEKHEEFGIKPWREKMKKNRLGVKGCFLSHYSIWLHCIEINQPIIVFEHDAILLRPLPHNLEFDEFLLLDPFNKMTKDYSVKHSIEYDFSIEEYFNESSKQKYGLKHQYAMGLQAYIIKPKAAYKLVESVKEFGYYPADMQCHKGILNLQTVYPSIASVNSKFYGNKTLMTSMSTTKTRWQETNGNI